MSTSEPGREPSGRARAAAEEPGGTGPTSAKPKKVSAKGGAMAGHTWRGSFFGALLTLPGIAWLFFWFIIPGYVVLALAFGTIDPIFRSPIPAWNPLHWSFTQFGFVFGHLVGPEGFFGPAVVRTVVYVATAMVLCLVISYPVAYFAARHSGRRRGLVIALLLAPFWISYMMRMLAWVNLLSDDGLVNRVISLNGLLPLKVDWLDGRATTVIFGLVYGYIPYLILPLYAALDRISPSMIEAARDLGAGRYDTFRRVILPMSVPGVAAGLVLVGLPMLGDYFTNDLLSNAPQTAMIGNLINLAVSSPGQAGQASALVALLVLALLIPMLLYVRSTTRGQDVRS
jgi:spermidine/putrescine transport system permease protein